MTEKTLFERQIERLGQRKTHRSLGTVKVQGKQTYLKRNKTRKGILAQVNRVRGRDSPSSRLRGLGLGDWLTARKLPSRRNSP